MKSATIFLFTWFFWSSLEAQIPGSWAYSNKFGQGELFIVYYDQIGLVEKNQSGQLQGFCIDLLNQFVDYVDDKHGKRISLRFFQQEDFNKYCELLEKQPFWLGIGNISITNERKLKYKFTPPYMANVLRLVTNVNTASILKPDELSIRLQGHNGYAISSSVSETVLEKMKKSAVPSINIHLKETAMQTLEAVSNDPKGFSIIDFTEVLTAKRKNLPIKFHPIKMDRTEDLGFMMSKKSDWDVIWNEFLTDEHKSGSSFRASLKKYFGSDFLVTQTSRK